MKPSPPPSDPADTRTLSLETGIAKQARTLWEGYDRPEGRDVEIWLEAERQVLGVDARVNQQAGGAVAEPTLHDALTPHAPTASTPDGGNITPREKPALRARQGG